MLRNATSIYCLILFSTLYISGCVSTDTDNEIVETITLKKVNGWSIEITDTLFVDYQGVSLLIADYDEDNKTILGYDTGLKSIVQLDSNWNITSTHDLETEGPMGYGRQSYGLCYFRDSLIAVSGIKGFYIYNKQGQLLKKVDKIDGSFPNVTPSWQIFYTNDGASSERIISPIFLWACNSHSDKVFNKENISGIVDNVEYYVDTLRIKFDEKTVESIDVFSTYSKEDTEYVLSYDSKNHRLLNINLNTEQIEQITELEGNGENGIGRIEGIYYHNSDSIFIYERSLFKIINTAGEVKASYDLTNSQLENVGFLYTNFDFKLVYNDKYHCVFLNNIYRGNRQLSLDNPVIVKLDLDRQEFSYLDVYYSDYLQENEGAFGYQFDINFNGTYGDYLYYTFPVESNIYRYSLTNRKITKYEAFSSFTSNNVPPLKHRADRDEGRINFVENPFFYGVLYDEKNQLFYRIHREGKPFDIVNDELNAITDVHFFITLLDSDFNFIGEMELPKNIYIQSTWFVSKGSLYMVASNRKYKNLKEGVLELHKFTFDAN